MVKIVDCIIDDEAIKGLLCLDGLLTAPDYQNVAVDMHVYQVKYMIMYSVYYFFFWKFVKVLHILNQEINLTNLHRQHTVFSLRFSQSGTGFNCRFNMTWHRRTSFYFNIDENIFVLSVLETTGIVSIMMMRGKVSILTTAVATLKTLRTDTIGPSGMVNLLNFRKGTQKNGGIFSGRTTKFWVPPPNFVLLFFLVFHEVLVNCFKS